MIITRTPLRISFVGGGSDLTSFYRDEPGMVVSTTIDKYIYVTVNRKHDASIRVCYSVTENVNRPTDLKHDLVKAALFVAQVKNHIEIHSCADVPAGTGLGSSSAFTVGLVHALSAYQKQYLSPQEIASIACHIEIGLCRHPVGKQDQYAAAIGGMNIHTFYPDENVTSGQIVLDPELTQLFHSHILLLEIGEPRSADAVLEHLNGDKREDMRKLVSFVQPFVSALRSGQIEDCGAILHAAWLVKRGILTSISNDAIDRAYTIARQHGAYGGKLCGAGGSGFLMILAPPDAHAGIIKTTGLTPLSFQFDKAGSQIIHAG